MHASIKSMLKTSPNSIHQPSRFPLISDLIHTMRRIFTLGLGLFLAALLTRSTPAQTMDIYIGTYTGEPKNTTVSRSEGIYRATFDPRDGSISNLRLAAPMDNPSFLAIDGERLAAVGETGWGRGQAGDVAFFRIQADGALVPSGKESSQGSGPAHVSINGEHVWIANYGGGSVARLPILAGQLLKADFVDQHHGSGPHKRRQQSAHAHCVVPHPSGRFVYSADLGTDTIHVSNADSGKSVELLKTSPGAGPRMIDFTPDGSRMLVIYELTGELALFDVDLETGKLKHRQTTTLAPEGYSGSLSGAHVDVSSDGQRVYASERGSDTVSTFSLNAEAGLTRLAVTPTGGNTPRHFTLTPDGKHLIVALQDTHQLTVFQLNDNGVPSPISNGRPLPIASPSCVVFAPTR
jgi:6-phosphogluconolactonase